MALYNGCKGNKHVRLSEINRTYIVSFRYGDSGCYRELLKVDDLGTAYRYYNDLLS